MHFHLLCEIPEPISREMNSEVCELTPEELRILKAQIRLNSFRIEEDVKRLELYVNKEKIPANETFLLQIRQRLKIAMEENDTFRKVLWNHCQSQDITRGHHSRFVR